MTSKVYFTDFHTKMGTSVPDKLEKLIKTAGISDIDFNRKFVAIKIHFGELGNMAYLRPNFAKRVVDVLKNLGGKPFLTDCSTLYVGARKNALDHLDAAYENGYSPFSTGCQVIIADGLKGTDEAVVPLNGTECVKEAKIGRAIMDADVVISLNHFKGHELTGFGGAVKNIGMGAASRAGKMEQHQSGTPTIDSKICAKCRGCAKVCAQNAIEYDSKGIARINLNKCVGCGRCIGVCNFDAISNSNWNANELLCKKMAEYALAVLQERPQFHINIVNQVSPYCDCHAENDIPIIPDVGMFASFDPVALDRACADMCNKQPVIAESVLAKNLEKKHADCCDHFGNSMPDTHWQDCLEHAEKIGLGTQKYELITVK